VFSVSYFVVLYVFVLPLCAEIKIAIIESEPDSVHPTVVGRSRRYASMAVRIRGDGDTLICGQGTISLLWGNTAYCV